MKFKSVPRLLLPAGVLAGLCIPLAVGAASDSGSTTPSGPAPTTTTSAPAYAAVTGVTGPTTAFHNSVAARYNYAFGKRSAEELYDLRKDPDEIANCADDPAYAAKKRELAAQLMKVLTDAKDPRVVDDPVPFERPPFTDPDPGPEKKKRLPQAPAK